ncbi:MAG: ABC transporter substrate-binding protein [Lentisphaeria bacterium]|nr:ABC transporter substrate-binding protein [Lentisphaeria bacterium]
MAFFRTILRDRWPALLPVPVAILVCSSLALFTNDPWPTGLAESNTFFTSYASSIKSLDPAVSYYVHEGQILDCIVEMPLAYDYLRRPYELVPMLASAVPTPAYYDRQGQILAGDPSPELVARAEYVITLKPGVRYQSHPCFARREDGTPRYRQIAPGQLRGITAPHQLPETATRELRAEDFKVALTRLCDPRLASPVYSTLASFISGMAECSDLIRTEISRLEDEARRAGREVDSHPVLPDYRALPLAGVELLGEDSFKIILSRKYPQLTYWLAMHFFAPIPWEALAFYHEPAVIDARLSFKNWPVGTGAYQMASCRPEDHIILERNPGYRLEPYPDQGSPEDEAAGLLADANRPAPFIDRLYFQFERESIPNWIKFLQGYYDDSGIPNDMFDAAVAMNPNGDLGLSDDMRARGIQLTAAVAPTIFYFGFNMLDPVVGGLAPEQQKLRQAISIVLDYQEFIDIFRNGRGLPAQGIIPPGIYGAETGPDSVNPFTDQWDDARRRPARLPLEHARRLLGEAGYPNGIGPDGAPLTLALDHAKAGDSSFKAQFQWLRHRLRLLGIDVQERPSDLNRWRNKLNTGNWQTIFNKGWLADYPDPENFLFLFYGPNATASTQGRGANYVNYASDDFDQVFKQLETMANGAGRRELIRQANRILQQHAPCCWGFHPTDFTLTHGWLKNFKPHQMGKTFMKYRRVDHVARSAAQRSWNRPRRWPVNLAAGILALVITVALWKKRTPPAESSRFRNQP